MNNPYRDRSIRVFFDMDVLPSFISKEFVEVISLDVSYLVTSLRVANPIEGIRNT